MIPGRALPRVPRVPGRTGGDREGETLMTTKATPQLRESARAMLADLESRDGGLKFCYRDGKTFDVIARVLRVFVAEHPVDPDSPEVVAP